MDWWKMVGFPCLPSSFLNTGAFLVAARGGASTPPATAGGRWEIRPMGPRDACQICQEAALDADAQQAKWKVGIAALPLDVTRFCH